MDRVWSETPPLQSPQQAVEANGSSIVNVELCKTECPSPAISPGPPDPESPTGPPGPEAVPSYPTGAVAPLDGTEGLGVIRDLKSLNPVDEGHTGVEDRELVYQSLDRYPISVSNSYVTYAPNYTSTTCSPSPYSTGTIRELKLNNYQIGSTQSSVLLQGYESPQHSLVSTSPGGTSLHYGPPTSIQSLPVQYPLGSHSPVPNQQPMWSTLNIDRHNSGTPYGLVPDLGCTVLDPQDVNRGYVCGGGATYIPTPPPPGDGLWASYADKNQTLPSMSGLNYMQDRRAYGDPPEYIRMVDPPLHQCAMCGVTESSAWRKDTTGQFVCNNCGVYRNGARASSMRQQKRMTTSRRVGMTCSNCSTNDTTLWRRNGQGEPVCNACGLYYKLHQINRPISMRKDSIQTRKRKPKHSSSTKGRASSTHSANGSGRSKSPSSSNCTQGSSAPPTPVYMGQGNSEGGTRDDTSPSPMLPSSATLSQQMQHLGPIDPHPQDDPSSYLIHQGMDAHHSVISIGHKLQSLHGV